MIVVDACVAVKWTVRERDHELASQLLGADTLTAPDLIFAEIANTFRKKVKNREITAQYALAGLHGVHAALAETIAASDLWPDAFEIARELDHHAYDCFYPALAARGGVMVSADEAFIRKCRASDYSRYVFDLRGWKQ